MPVPFICTHDDSDRLLNKWTRDTRTSRSFCGFYLYRYKPVDLSAWPAKVLLSHLSHVVTFDCYRGPPSVFSHKPIYAFNAGDGCQRGTATGGLCVILLWSTNEYAFEFDKSSNFRI